MQACRPRPGVIVWSPKKGMELIRLEGHTDNITSLAVAPNGTMLIYATQDQGRGILAVVSIDGRVKYRLPSSAGDVREPAWSPFLD